MTSAPFLLMRSERRAGSRGRVVLRNSRTARYVAVTSARAALAGRSVAASPTVVTQAAAMVTQAMVALAMQMAALLMAAGLRAFLLMAAGLRVALLMAGRLRVATSTAVTLTAISRATVVLPGHILTAARRAVARQAEAAAVGTAMAVDLRTKLGHIELPNPVMTASGCAGAGRELAQFIDVSKIGAIVTKSVMLSPRSGRPTPRMAETPSGMLNSIGLQGPGIDAFLQRDLPWLLSRGARAVVSIAGGTIAEYADLAGRLSDAAGVTAIEVNISCPNVEHRGQVFACDPDASAAVIEAVRTRARYDIPVFAKLSPDVTDIVPIAKACVSAGADGLSMINTLLGMVIDTDTMRPRLAGLTGGLSGPAIRPIAVRCIWQVREALPGVPIIGMGGVRTGRDALELILAGASMVSVGTTIFHDPSACARILHELEEELTVRGVDRLADVVGLAHQPPAVTGRALSPSTRLRRS
jgi:dihydroorotate dehydrogenase (NAD+) catalytic subunit